jgi:FdhD protein
MTEAAGSPGSGVVVSVPCRRYRDGETTATRDDIAVEVGIQVTVGGGPVKRLFAAPLELDVLAVGHAWLEMTPPGHVPVTTQAAMEPDCRRFHFDVAPAAPRAVARQAHPLAAALVVALMRRFIAAPGLWDGTGCFHRAAAYDPETGGFPFRAEDIGRHNCLDRLCGQAFLAHQDLSGRALFLSARLTASMCDKALRAGFPCVVSRSAVTTEAVRLAEEAGLSLAGFAREAENRFTIFCDAAGWFAP